MTDATVDSAWVDPGVDPAAVTRLADALECSPLLASLLANRGYTDPAAAAAALDPTPADIHPSAGLPDVDIAVDRLVAALDRDDAIGVFGDRDVDGVAGTAILTRLLRAYDGTPTVLIPDKWDGYGLSAEAVDALVDDGVGCLVTVDCGTTAIDEIARARDGGIDVLVVDHHAPDESLPAATALVNPRRPDSSYLNSDLAAGALAWKVGQALVERRDPVGIEAYHDWALPLAAVATCGDYMALTPENRAIVREGVDRLASCDLPGLAGLVDHCGVETARDLRWSLAPLLNAAQEAESGAFMLEVLLERDAHRIEVHLDRLEDYRAERRRARADRLAHLEDCLAAQVDVAADALFVVETERWVGGGATSAIAERYHRPVVAYREADDGYTGGGRTGPDVDLLALYEACSAHLAESWGHPGAAGFRVGTDDLDAFLGCLRSTLRARHDPAAFRPRIDVDAIVEPGALDRATVAELERFGPYGPGHDEPVVRMDAVTVEAWTTFGEEDRHWKGYPAATDDLVLVHWDGARDLPVAALPGVIDVVGTVGMDDYEGCPRLTVDDVRVR